MVLGFFQNIKKMKRKLNHISLSSVLKSVRQGMLGYESCAQGRSYAYNNAETTVFGIGA